MELHTLIYSIRVGKIKKNKEICPGVTWISGNVRLGVFNYQ